jgi:hypothetical protein
MAELAARPAVLARGVRLEALTVGWMAIEAAVAIGAGVAARSVLLTAFGADILVGLLSGATLLWRLRVESAGGDDRRIDAVEKRALEDLEVLDGHRLAAVRADPAGSDEAAEDLTVRTARPRL